MAYTDFDPTKPDATTQTLGQMGTSMRNNELAIRDMMCGNVGGFAGWNLAAYDSSNNNPPLTDPDKPAYIVLSKGTERVKLTITWSTSGVTDGYPTRLVFSYSSDSGSTYDVIKGGTTNGYCDMTYDAAGNLTNTTWS